MLMSVPPTPTAQDAVLARMSAVLNHAAETEHVTPDEFRAAIEEAIAYAKLSPVDMSYDTSSPEAFVLSLVGRLF